MIVDFHSHTCKSDGTLPPAHVYELMVQRGVEIFSITDHDTLDAYDELADATGGPRIIVGIELNTAHEGSDVHVLGYGMPARGSSIDIALVENRIARVGRVEQMVQLLNEAGLDVCMDDVYKHARDASAIGRPHIARALLTKGYVETLDEAFTLFLHHGQTTHIPSLHLSPFRAIESILEAGGVPVLAHPGRIRDQSLVERLATAGLRGMEVFYPTHTPEQTARYRAIAEANDLVLTAGADFHDPRWTPRGVGMDVDAADIAPFLELVSAAEQRSRRVTTASTP